MQDTPQGHISSHMHSKVRCGTVSCITAARYTCMAFIWSHTTQYWLGGLTGVIQCRHALAVGVLDGHVIAAALKKRLPIGLLEDAALGANAPLQLLPSSRQVLLPDHCQNLQGNSRLSAMGSCTCDL